MGSNKSKSKSDIINNAVASVIINHMSTCSAAIAQSQGVNIQGSIVLFSSTKQKAVLSQKCVEDFKFDANIIQDITSKIKQEAAANGIALLSALQGTNAEAVSSVQTNIQTNVTENVIKQSMSNISQYQPFNIQGSFVVGTSAEQSASMLQQDIVNHLTSINFAQSVASDVDQKATSTVANPLDFLKDIFGAIGTAWMMVIMIAVVISVIVIALIARAGSHRREPRRHVNPQ